MACTPGILVRVPASVARDDVLHVDRQPPPGAIRRSSSTGDELYRRSRAAGMVRRSRSETFLLRCALKPPPGGGPSPPESKIKYYRGPVGGIFPYYEHGFRPEEGKMVVLPDGGDVEGPHQPLHQPGKRKRSASWVERLLELRRQWKDRQLIEEAAAGDGDGDGAGSEEESSEEPCAAVYDSEEEEERYWEVDRGGEGKAAAAGVDRAAFSALLAAAPLAEIKLFSQLAFLCNAAYVIPQLKRTGALVHRGIYEAAKGIYEQFLPEILSHLRRHGGRARLRFTGHSLGGSLSLLVHLMLLARGAVPPRALLPAVTFGSPFVFCGGRRVLDELGLDDGDQVRCVMMHRDIVPRAFSCSYPDYVARLLKRLNRSFRSHPCLNNDKLLYSPLGKLYILQPDEKASPPHPLLPAGCALYAVDGGGASGAAVARAVRAFLNSPHPLETLSHPAAYGSEGTILRDHESGNYLKAVNEVLRRHTKWVVRRPAARRLQQQHWWPLLTVTVRDDHPWRPTVRC